MKKTYLLIGSCAVIGGGALLALSPLAAAIPTPWKSSDPAAPFYQNMVQRSGNPAQTLNDLSARQAARDAWDNMTPAQKQQQIAQSSAKFQAYAAQQQAKQEASPQAVVANTVVSGLGSVDPIFPAVSFHQLPTAWTGSVNGAQVVVVSGYVPTNPNQAVLVVEANGPAGPTSSYPTPTATGPAQIMSVNGNVITLQSQGGAWDADTANGQATTVTTKGGVTYKFDVAKRAFVQ